jgi:hypothetical protein
MVRLPSLLAALDHMAIADSNDTSLGQTSGINASVAAKIAGYGLDLSALSEVVFLWVRRSARA